MSDNTNAEQWGKAPADVCDVVFTEHDWNIRSLVGHFQSLRAENQALREQLEAAKRRIDELEKFAISEYIVCDGPYLGKRWVQCLFCKKQESKREYIDHQNYCPMKEK